MREVHSSRRSDKHNPSPTNSQSASGCCSFPTFLKETVPSNAPDTDSQGSVAACRHVAAPFCILTTKNSCLGDDDAVFEVVRSWRTECRGKTKHSSSSLIIAPFCRRIQSCDSQPVKHPNVTSSFSVFIPSGRRGAGRMPARPSAY